MRRLTVVALAALMLVALAAPASAHGLTPDKLGRAGWGCMTEDLGGGETETHCWKGDLGAFIAGGVGTTNIMVFHNGHFAAAETVTWEDASGRACPGEGRTAADGWGFAPFGAYACHHYPASG